MVLWSYLLLSVPAAASLERVLAPLAPDPHAAADAEAQAAPTAAETATEAPRPLVTPGADELDLLAELENQLAAKLEPAGILRLIPVSPLPRLAAATALPKVELVEHPARLTGPSLLLRFRLVADGRVLGYYTLSCRAQVLAQIWTPSRQLGAGEPLDAGAVEAREVDLLREPKAVLADAALFGRYELARPATPDRALTWNDLSPRALVRKGQLVDVVAAEGRLSIAMRGLATRSGALGEVVTIRNLESKREFPAEVVDENKVRVQF